MQFCQECGAEHESWATACVFCDGALGPERPDPAPEPDHGTVELDVADLAPEQLHHLDLLLVAADLPYVAGPGSRTVPSSRADEAIELIDLASSAGGDIDEVVESGAAGPVVRSASAPSLRWPVPIGRGTLGGRRSRGSDASAAPVMATTPQRVWAQVVNWFGLSCLISIPFIPLAGVLGRGTSVTQFVAVAVVCVITTGIWGVDLGQLLCRVQVVGTDGRAPGVARAALRVAVVDGPLIAYYAVTWALYLGGFRFDASAPAWAGWLAWIAGTAAMFVWPLAVLVSIANGPHHQGWHDRLAGTFVLSTSGQPRQEALRRVRAEGWDLGGVGSATAPEDSPDEVVG